MKEPRKRKNEADKETPSRKKDETEVIKLEDLVPKKGVRGGGKTFFGGKSDT